MSPPAGFSAGRVARSPLLLVQPSDDKTAPGAARGASKRSPWFHAACRWVWLASAWRISRRATRRWRRGRRAAGRRGRRRGSPSLCRRSAPSRVGVLRPRRRSACLVKGAARRSRPAVGRGPHGASQPLLGACTLRRRRRSQTGSFARFLVRRRCRSLVSSAETARIRRQRPDNSSRSHSFGRFSRVNRQGRRRSATKYYRAVFCGRRPLADFLEPDPALP